MAVGERRKFIALRKWVSAFKFRMVEYFSMPIILCLHMKQQSNSPLWRWKAHKFENMFFCLKWPDWYLLDGNIKNHNLQIISKSYYIENGQWTVMWVLNIDSNLYVKVFGTQVEKWFENDHLYDWKDERVSGFYTSFTNDTALK